jgi:mannose-6-phosphate isomerase-like protein (cupin superfamily)
MKGDTTMATNNPLMSGQYRKVTGTEVKVQTQRLDGRDVRKMTNVAQVIRVVAGSAWITLNGEDIFVNRGEQVRVEPGEHPPVISGVNGRSVVYEIWR